MGRDISISISARDNFSAVITKMKTATAQFRAEGADLQEQLDALNKQKVDLQIDATKAQAELREAKKGLDDTQESMQRLGKAQFNVNTIKQNLNLVNRQVRETEKAYASLSGAVETAHQKLREEVQPAAASSSGGKGLTALFGGISKNFAWSEIANSELVGQLIDTAAQAGSYYIGSAYGSEAASSLSSVISGGLDGLRAGAAIGSLFGGPGLGTIIGGAIGGVAGTVSGAVSAEIDKQQSRDDYFKDYYQDFYNDLQSGYQSSLSNGQTVAAEREQTALAFSTLLGSDSAAEEWVGWMKDFAAVTPFVFEDLSSMSRTALSYGFSTEEAKGVMQAVGDAGSALGLSGSDLSEMAAYLGRMNMSDKVSLEYLNPLIERGIPAIQYIADAMSSETGESWDADAVYEAISKGELDGSEMVVEVLERMEDDFRGSMDKQSQTYEGLTATLEDTMTDLDAAMGEGYNTARKSSLQSQIDFYGGDAGDMMSEAYNLIGQWQASMDNLHDELKMDALSGVMNSLDFKNAVGSGTAEGAAEAGRMLAEALATAEAEYTQSEGYDLMMQAQTDVIDSVRTDLSEANYLAGYDLAQQFTLGIEAANNANRERVQASYAALTPSNAGGGGNTVLGGGDASLESAADAFFWASGDASIYPHAGGLSYVPYNGYPARLHEGERVLTAEENRAFSSGTGGGVVITGNSFTVRQDSDIEAIGEAIYQRILKASRLRA